MHKHKYILVLVLMTSILVLMNAILNYTTREREIERGTAKRKCSLVRDH